MYCSKDCQRAHWKANHKHYCIAKADRALHPQNSVSPLKIAASKTSVPDMQCAICMDLVTDTSSATSLHCTHVFHGACVAELRKFGLKQVCPLCRTPLTSRLETLFEESTRKFLVVDRLVSRGEVSWSSLPAWAQHELDAAISGWREAADQGFSFAQANMGFVFKGGRGVPQSNVEAFRWYTKAANQGIAEAQFQLGVMHEHGKGGVVQSDAKSAHWWRKAADQGNIHALYGLGVLYQGGRGVAQSSEEAARCWQKAADQGLPMAQCNLGNSYRSGRGVAQSYAKAAMWLKKAADQGVMEAQYNLALLLQEGRGVAQSDMEGARCFRKAAAQGLARAQYNLGSCYVHGRGVEKCQVEAVRWFKKAADQGHTEAQCWTVLRMRPGRG